VHRVQKEGTYCFSCTYLHDVNEICSILCILCYHVFGEIKLYIQSTTRNTTRAIWCLRSSINIMDLPALRIIPFLRGNGLSRPRVHVGTGMELPTGTACWPIRPSWLAWLGYLRPMDSLLAYGQCGLTRGRNIFGTGQKTGRIEDGTSTQARWKHMRPLQTKLRRACWGKTLSCTT